MHIIDYYRYSQTARLDRIAKAFAYWYVFGRLAADDEGAAKKKIVKVQIEEVGDVTRQLQETKNAYEAVPVEPSAERDIGDQEADAATFERILLSRSSDVQTLDDLARQVDAMVDDLNAGGTTTPS